MINKVEKCLHPVLAKREQKWFCKKIQEEMKKQGIGYLITYGSQVFNLNLVMAGITLLLILSYLLYLIMLFDTLSYK